MTIAVQAHDEVLGAAREVAAEIAPRADLHDREGSFSQENIDALWRVGIGSLSLPETHGGPGANLRTTAAAVRAVAAGDASTALVWVMHLIYLQVLADDSFGVDPAVRARVFASALAGPALINALRVEPELGTPPAGASQRPARSRPRTASGSPGARSLDRQLRPGVDDRLGGDDRTTPPGSAAGRSSCPPTHRASPIVETWDHLGMRASASHDVVFEGAPIPLDHAAALLPAGASTPACGAARVMAG